jgi:hypothetical protein
MIELVKTNELKVKAMYESFVVLEPEVDIK